MKKWLTLSCLLFITIWSRAQQPPVNQLIDSAEYFFDKDTGTGKQIMLPGVSLTNVFTDTPVINIPAGLSDGLHTMHIRAKTDSGGWGLYSSAMFYVRNDLENEPKIDSAEYFFDKDMGVTHSLPLSVGMPDTIITLNPGSLTAGMAEGLHTLHIRVKNAVGRWSHYASQLFYVTSTVDNMPPIVSCEYFLDHDPGVGMGDSITKRTFTNPADTVNETFSVMLPAGLDTGKHYIYVRVKDAAGHWSLFTDSITSQFTLPITGLTLTAEKREKTSLLNWFTLTESNSNHFEVEKSTNSISFTSIGSVKSKGNSSSKSNYSFIDKEPAPGLNFYRIREIDNDAKITYSQIVKLWFDKGAGTLSIYPNPAATFINVKYESNSETAIINLFNAAGQWVKMYRLPTSNNLQINIGDLASGSYTIHISDGLKSETGKFIKK